MFTQEDITSVKSVTIDFVEKMGPIIYDYSNQLKAVSPLEPHMVNIAIVGALINIMVAAFVQTYDLNDETHERIKLQVTEIIMTYMPD